MKSIAIPPFLLALAALGCGAEGPSVALLPVGPPREGVLDRTFDDLKFDIEPDAPFDAAMLTEELLALDGERVRIRGYILPGAQSRFAQFVLVRDNQECCFGPGAALYDCVLVEMSPDKHAEFSIRPVTVVGSFALEEFVGPEGRLLAIYRMTADEVEN